MSQNTKLGTLHILFPSIPLNDPTRTLIQAEVKRPTHDYIVCSKTETEHRKLGLKVHAFTYYVVPSLFATYN